MSEDITPIEGERIDWIAAWCQAIMEEHEREIDEDQYVRIEQAADEKFTQKKESGNNE
jgi:hypothetical protein